MLCISCLNQDLKNSEICVCGSKNLVKKRGRSYIFNGQAYSKKEWLAIMSELRAQRMYLFTGKEGKINPLYLQSKFLENIRIHTFIRLLLPACFFIFLSFFISLVLILKEKNYLKEIIIPTNTAVFGIFIAFFLLGLALINLKRIFINKIRVMARIRNKRIIYQQIKPSHFFEIMKEIGFDIRSKQ